MASGGKSSRTKGLRWEREIVNQLKAKGIQAERVPLSGSAGGSFSGDILIRGYTAEVKARASGEGFRRLEQWKGDNDFLILARDRAKPVVLIDIDMFIKFLSYGFPKKGDGEN